MNWWMSRDPRAAAVLMILLSLAAAVLPIPRTAWLVPVVLALLLSVRLDGAGWGGWLRAVLLLWGLSLLANAFLVPGTRLGPEALGILRPTDEGLRLGATQGIRLGVLAGLGLWGARAIRALDLGASLEWGVRGWPWLRRRVHRAVLPAVLASRLVPGFVDEAQRIREVERLRRPPGERPGLRRAAELVPLWMGLVVDRAEALAQALVLRGYQPEGHRGFAREFRFDGWDWLLVGGGAALVAVLGRV